MKPLITFAQSSVNFNPDNIPRVNVDQNTVGNAFNSILMLAGAVAVIFVVLGGIKYSSSQGDPGELKKAKDMIVYALVGLVVVILSFAIIQLFTGKVF